jgi:hypothetical protein
MAVNAATMADLPLRPVVAPAAAVRPVLVEREPVSREPADDIRPRRHGVFDTASTPPVSDNMFTTAQTPAGFGRRFAVVAGIGAIVIAAAGVGLVGTGRGEAVTGSESSAAAVSAPLELLSLRHVRQGDSIAITGLVRNPAAGAEIRQLTAVAFLFDKSGSFLNSGRASLDFATLKPGEESPFTITVPAAGGVSRYRVSFRTETGGVVAHADRREQPPGGVAVN